MSIDPAIYDQAAKAMRHGLEYVHLGHTIKLCDWGFFTVTDQATGNVVLGPAQNTLPECIAFIDERVSA